MNKILKQPPSSKAGATVCSQGQLISSSSFWYGISQAACFRNSKWFPTVELLLSLLLWLVTLSNFVIFLSDSAKPSTHFAVNAPSSKIGKWERPKDWFGCCIVCWCVRWCCSRSCYELPGPLLLPTLRYGFAFLQVESWYQTFKILNPGDFFQVFLDRSGQQ